MGLNPCETSLELTNDGHWAERRGVRGGTVAVAGLKGRREFRPIIIQINGS